MGQHSDGPDERHRRPAGVSDDTVAALGSHGRPGHEARPGAEGYSEERASAGRRRMASSAMITVATISATQRLNSQESSETSFAATGAWTAASRKPSQARRR
ncbi:hypothetical protein GA0070624_2922 [Micromonospora rhizosphaerae]|uniref:Uncharacterized protein n=1 Tax=Micromonospora rhizosphaerae TaxID=568872 RepID=A0A1C6S4N2_9ACTN|nr:hypothetical protein GA0070624_2922 [Micromonospora rhizosphaerae]